jgi:hypothetical protein
LVREVKGKEPPTARRKQSPVKVEPTAGPVAGNLPEILRRSLLGLVTVLLVAGPLLPGEDPGRLAPTTGTAGLFLTLLWLFAAVGWAAWRAWLVRVPCRVSRVEWGLLAVGVVLFLSAIVAGPYRHPAWLVCWEWLAVLAAFWLVRQMPRSEEDNNALLAAVLATVVSLAAQGIYQAINPPVPLRIDPTLAHIHALDLDAPAPPAPDRRLVRATFAESGSFAAFLTLAAPALAIGCFLVFRKKPSPPWPAVMIGLFAGLVFVALGMARWWPAVLALLALVGAWLYRVRNDLPGKVRLGISGGLVALLVLLFTTVWRADFLAVGDARSTSAGNTLQLLGNRWLLGIGPGHFSRLYPAVLESPAIERVSQPGNFLLETLAAGGLLALAALVFALVAFFWRVGPEISGPDFDRVAEGTPADASSAVSTRWEFYIGAVVALTAVFLPQIGGQPVEQLIPLAILAAVRSLIWFAAFALFTTIPWTPRWRLVAITAGVLALLLCLLVTGGSFYPSVAQPLWIMVALALNAVPGPAAEPATSRVSRLLPVTALLVVWWLYLLMAFLPVVAAARAANHARLAYPSWRETAEPRWLEALATSSNVRAGMQTVERVSDFLRRTILEPLELAVEIDPTDAGLRVELAYWYARHWELYARIPDRLPTPEANKVRQTMEEYADKAMAQLQQAQPLDPRGKASFWVALEVRMLFTEQFGLKKEQVFELRKMAGNQLRKLIEADPSDPRPRYRVVEVLRPVPEDEIVRLWRQEAERAIQLDALGPSRRSLTDKQRQQLKDWLAGK